MSDINELRAEITHMRSLVTAADQDSMDNKQLLRYQTTLLGALRETQNSMNTVLLEQGQALGGMVLAISGLQERVTGVEERVTGVQERLTGIDQNVVAIMRHLGV